MMVRPLIKLIVLSFYCVTFVKSFDFPNESANIILAIMDYFKICNPIIINTLLKNQDLILVTYLLVYMNDFAVWVTKKRFHQSKDIGRTP